MKLTELIKKGDIKYTYSYCETMTSNQVAHHIAKVPKVLKTLVKKNISAKVVIYGDDSIGIDINDKTWASQNHKGKILNHKIWLYLNLALDRDQPSGENRSSIISGWVDEIDDNTFLN